MSSDLRVPHFLRVTQALALVSGLGLSGCSGSVTTTSSGSDASNVGDDSATDGAGTCTGVCIYEGGPLGVGLYDGSPMGVVVGGGVQPYDGGPTGVGVIDGGVVAYDGGPVGVGIYDGGPVGVRPYDGGPLGIGIAPDGGILVGGPLIAPELPA